MASFRYAISAWVWYGEPSANGYDFIDKAASIGYDGVEIPTFDGNIDENAINQKLQSVSGNLKAIVVGGGSPDKDVSSTDTSIREKGLEYIKKLIDKADRIESDMVCGPLYSAVGKALYLTDEEKKKSLQRTAGVIKDAAKYAADKGIEIALEPLCRYDSYLINTTEQMMSFIEMTDSPNVGILLDTFHMNIEEDSMIEPILLAGEKFRHFQVCENNRGVPGKGQMDWEGIRKTVKRSGYNGWISLESFTPYDRVFSEMMRSWRPLDKDQDTFAKDGLAFLKKIFR